MSFSIDIEIKDVDGNTHVLPVVRDMYGNVKPMWEKALGEGAPGILDGAEGREVLASLEASAIDIIINEQDYRDLGEGRGAPFITFRDAIFDLVRVCTKYPSGILRWTE